MILLHGHNSDAGDVGVVGSSRRQATSKICSANISSLSFQVLHWIKYDDSTLPPSLSVCLHPFEFTPSFLIAT